MTTPAYLTALRQAIQKAERYEINEIDEKSPHLNSFNSFISSSAELSLVDSQSTCLQCGKPIGPGSREITVRSTGSGELTFVHEDCLDAWQRRGPPR